MLPAIVSGLREGKTIDEIEDIIRFSGQSDAFSGPIRDAAQSVLMNVGKEKAEQSLDFIDDELTKGNVTGVKNKLKKLARDTAGTEMSRNIMGKERTIEFLGEIQDDLDLLERNGINTNIFAGTTEDINKKIGRVNSPELRKVATKIQTAVQNYRRSMSGVAFSVPESEEYKSMFPSIGRTANFNTANIQALTETIKGDLDNFYGLSMGPENYQTLFGDVGQGAEQGDVQDKVNQARQAGYTDEEIQAYLNGAR
jgi:hypothetical protein